jgi:hypothetical protein
VTGANELVVRGTNGAICGRVCTYTENPAGVVFGAAISYTPAATPTPDPSPDDDVAATAVPTAPPTSTSAVTEGSGAGGSTLPVLAALALVTAVATFVASRKPARRAR